MKYQDHRCACSDALYCIVFARTSGNQRDVKAITAFIVPARNKNVEEHLWTFNMPTDHLQINLRNAWMPNPAVSGSVDGGLRVAYSFVQECQIRQAASEVSTASMSQSLMHESGNQLDRLSRTNK